MADVVEESPSPRNAGDTAASMPAGEPTVDAPAEPETAAVEQDEGGASGGVLEGTEEGEGGKDEGIVDDVAAGQASPSGDAPPLPPSEEEDEGGSLPPAASPGSPASQEEPRGRSPFWLPGD